MVCIVLKTQDVAISIAKSPLGQYYQCVHNEKDRYYTHIQLSCVRWIRNIIYELQFNFSCLLRPSCHLHTSEMAIDVFFSLFRVVYRSWYPKYELISFLYITEEFNCLYCNSKQYTWMENCN